MSNRRSKRIERDETVNEVVSELKPVDFSSKHFPAFTPEPQNSKTTSTQKEEITEQLPVQSDTPQVGETISTPAKEKPKKYPHYTTHLRPDTVKAIKRQAVEEEVNDYDVVQEALDIYFGLKPPRHQ